MLMKLRINHCRVLSHPHKRLEFKISCTRILSEDIQANLLDKKYITIKNFYNIFDYTKFYTNLLPLWNWLFIINVRNVITLENSWTKNLLRNSWIMKGLIFNNIVEENMHRIIWTVIGKHYWTICISMINDNLYFLTENVLLPFIPREHVLI